MAQAGAEGRARSRSASAPSGLRHIPGRSLALAGNYIAALLPDGSGVQLIDALAGTPLRRLSSPGNAIVGVIADPTGQRLVTIERTLEELVPPEVAALEGGEDPAPAGEYKVNLWELDSLEWIKTLDPWRESRSGRFIKPPPQTRPPLVAISPDGKIVAVAPSSATWVRLFSARDGGLRGPWDRVETQAEVSALALGPNALMAAAGRDQVRLYDTDNNRATLVTSFQTRVPSFTWLMRFSPVGTLALAGWGGPIELWDPAAQSRIAVLTGSDQSSDLAFSPDGRTLAAIGWTGVTSTWSIQDSASADAVERLRGAPHITGLRGQRDPGRRRNGRRRLGLARREMPRIRHAPIVDPHQP